MIKNLLKTAFRSIVRDKGYSLLNVMGLTIGITSSIFLFLYILDELSYDQYHENKNNIYRVITHIKEGDDEFTWVVAFVEIFLARGLTSKSGAEKKEYDISKVSLSIMVVVVVIFFCGCTVLWV